VVLETSIYSVKILVQIHKFFNYNFC